MPCIVRRTASRGPPQWPAGPGEAEPAHPAGNTGQALRRAPPLRQPPAASPGASIGRGLRHQLDPEWQPLIACVARVSRLTFEKDTRSGLWPSREEIGYYACQIRLDADARAVRSHRGIENRDHYVRDVGEDDSRIRHRPGAMARIRSAALNILRANGIQNVSQALYINALNFISTPSTSTGYSRSDPHDQN